MPDLIIDEVDFQKTMKVLIHLFKKASELQVECGNEYSEDIYEQMAVKPQYKEYLRILVEITDVVSNHKYNVRNILQTALSPKLNPFGDKQTRIQEIQDKLPDLPHNWEFAAERAINEITRAIAQGPTLS